MIFAGDRITGFPADPEFFIRLGLPERLEAG
jgi:hypothetical protein